MVARKSGQSALVSPDRVAQAILLVRGQKVILDEDLANLYEVETKALNRAVRRNLDRLPEDFMLQLTTEEFTNLRFQSGTSNLRSQFGTSRWGGRRYRPYAFTEQGVAMLSSVLHSVRAIRVNIEIMRAFVRLRRLLATHADLARQLAALEKKYDAQFRVVFDAIRELMNPPEPNKRFIGFVPGQKEK